MVLYEHIIGTIPSYFGTNLTKLSILNMYSNSLNGIFHEMSYCYLCLYIFIEFAYLGTIPSNFGSLTKLTVLTMHLNGLNGIY